MTPETRLDDLEHEVDRLRRNNGLLIAAVVALALAGLAYCLVLTFTMVWEQKKVSDLKTGVTLQKGLSNDSFDDMDAELRDLNFKVSDVDARVTAVSAKVAVVNDNVAAVASRVDDLKTTVDRIRMKVGVP